MKLYVGNLPLTVKDEDLRKLFEEIGLTVKSAKVINDRETGRSRGFGFVEVGSREEGQKAISELNGKTLGTNSIVVNEASPPRDRRDGNNNPFKKRFR